MYYSLSLIRPHLDNGPFVHSVYVGFFFLLTYCEGVRMIGICRVDESSFLHREILTPLNCSPGAQWPRAAHNPMALSDLHWRLAGAYASAL